MENLGSEAESESQEGDLQRQSRREVRCPFHFGVLMVINLSTQGVTDFEMSNDFVRLLLLLRITCLSEDI